jgi:hypothetical protein
MKFKKHLKNSWYKYLIEILVVVIGILIAFNLDNWNSKRQIKTDEIQVLKEINKGLKRLQKEVEINLEDEIDIFNSCNLIKNNFENNKGVNDSLKTAFSLTWFYTHIQPDYGPYDYLNNYGSSVITNTSLRESILDLYGLDLRATVNESNIRGQYIEALKLQMGEWFKTLNSNSIVNVPTEPWDYNILRNDNHFNFQLNKQLNESIRWSNELSGLLKHIEEIKSLVSKEINKLEH